MMGPHILESGPNKGQWQSDKYPELNPDELKIKMTKPESWPAMAVLADSLEIRDPEFSADLRERLRTIKIEVYGCECGSFVATGLYFYPSCPNCKGTGKHKPLPTDDPTRADIEYQYTEPVSGAEREEISVKNTPKETTK